MEKISPPYKRQVLVCINERDTGACCAKNGSVIIHQTLKDYVNRNRLNNIIRITKMGCSNLCNEGPVVVIQPDNIWFRHVSMNDVEEIIKKYLS
jgi:NADH-quinone oxidoreductase subunit F